MIRARPFINVRRRKESSAVNGNRVEDDCLYVSGKLVCPGDPVKVAGKQGLFRLTDILNDYDVEVVGPYFPRSPQRTQEITRILKLTNLRYAAKASRMDVSMTLPLQMLSDKARKHK